MAKRALWIVGLFVVLGFVVTALSDGNQWAASLGERVAEHDGTARDSQEAARWAARDLEKANARRRQEYCAEHACDPR